MSDKPKYHGAGSTAAVILNSLYGKRGYQGGRIVKHPTPLYGKLTTYDRVSAYPKTLTTKKEGA